MGGRLLLGTVLATALGGAGSAHAATATLFHPATGSDAAIVRYQAAAGEKNNLRVARTGGDEVTLSDGGATIVPSPGCEARDAHTVVCRPQELLALDVDAGNRDDSVAISGSLRSTRIRGGAGGDTLRGGSGSDSIYGGDGNDSLDGGDGVDALFGGPGGDSLFGAADGDSLVGGRGRDLLAGGDGFDQIDSRDPGRGDAADVVGCGPGGDSVDARRPQAARVRDADLITTDCEQLRLNLPFTGTTVPSRPMDAESFALSFSCPRRSFRLGCLSAVLMKRGATVLASGRRRLDNGRETLVRTPLTPAGRSLARSGAAFPALIRVSYRVRHANKTATFRLLLPPPR